MIFATVGTQLPFHRLLLALDTWAALNPSVQVVAQTGRTSASYNHMRTFPQMDQRQFAETVARARVVVAHAGMGTILTALETGKPLILMPRRADLGEHRNDHQIDTAAEMASLSNVTVAADTQALCTALNRAMSMPPVQAGRGADVAPPQLIEAVRSFIWADQYPQARP
ncbi:glycosyltransferase [Neotabrizicola shimadae]|uniref:Glycosyltransferase family 28 protein n=1 Tax=Neotabrizicola shimadae TaxID=2807096 RepID=A0A8G0ZWC0_9RHOB|nr:glycosyltransferase [Neotabrizicola shimadae]QYZ69219.1 glycosyltransferase family 28 protein [Neotabrizicola shimadae]